MLGDYTWNVIEKESECLAARFHAADFKIMDERYRLDLNTVDPEREMAVLSETRMMYTAFMRIATSKLTTLKSVIAGR